MVWQDPQDLLAILVLQDPQGFQAAQVLKETGDPQGPKA